MNATTVFVLSATSSQQYQELYVRPLIKLGRKDQTQLVFISGYNTRSAWQKTRLLLKSIKERKNCGIIFLSHTFINFLDKSECLEILADLKDTPLINVGIELEDVTTIKLDTQIGTTEATRYLIEVKGRRNIVYLSGPEHHLLHRDKIQAFENCVANYKDLKSRVVHTDTNRKSAFELADSIISEQNPDAFLCANDEMAKGVIQACQENQKIPGKDISIIGFDNYDNNRFEMPQLSSIQSPLAYNCQQAYHLLLAKIKNEPSPPYRVMPSFFIKRESCGYSTFDDINLEALGAAHYNHFIHLANLKTASHIPHENLDKHLKVVQKELDTLKDSPTALPSLIERTSHLENLELNHFGEPELWQDLRSFLRQYLFLGSTENIKLEAILQSYRQSESKIERELYREGHLRVNLLKRAEALTNTILTLQSNSATLSNLKNMASNWNDMGFFGLKLLLSRRFGYYIQEENSFRSTKKKALYRNQYYCLDLFDGYRSSRVSDMSVSENEGFDWLLQETPELSPKYVLPLSISDEFFGFMTLETQDDKNILTEFLKLSFLNYLQLFETNEQRKLAEKRLTEALEILEQSNQTLQKQSLQDPLTGLGNRRKLMTQGEEIFKNSLAKELDFSLFFIDLDRLKQINDVHGHDEGDFAIRSVGKILKSSFRKPDLVCRVGGDEFIAIIQEAAQDKIKNIEKRLYENKLKLNRELEKDYEISFSIGIANLKDEKVSSFTELIKAADNHLYNNKHSH